MSYELPEPLISRRERSITARYETGQMTEATEYNKPKKILFTFQVGYDKAGINYWNGTRTTIDFFTVSVINETVEERGGISFVMGSGLGLAKVPNPNNRFSRKKLQTVWDEWKEKIEGIFSVDSSLLDEDELNLLDAISPYLDGRKAGLA